MNLSVVSAIAVLDRTGAVQDAMDDVAVAVFDIGHPRELEDEWLDVDVLVLGARELSPTGLRRLARWRRHHPASIMVAHVEDVGGFDRASLRAAGVEHAMRGPMTRAKLRTALVRADDALAELLEATGRWHPTAVVPEQYAGQHEARDDDDVDDEEFFDDELYDDADLTTSGPRAKVITVASATGGCGKTFFATTLASLLVRRKLRVLVLDL